MGQGHGKGGAFAVNAVEGNGAVHHFHQVVGDGQSQPRAFHVLVPLHVEPLEAFEQPGLVFFANADARIADDEPQHRLILVGSRRVGNGEVDGSPLRVFDCVGQEVDEDLLDAPRVPVQAVGHFGVDLDMELEPLGLGPWAHHAGDRLDQLRQPVLRFHDAELARLDLREIEDVVDDGKQRGARRADAPRIASHCGVLRLPQDHLVQAQYRIDRRADLVAHAGEEFALGLAGLVRQLLLLFQRLAAGGFLPRHDQVRARRQEDHQQEGGDPDAAGKDGGHGPGHRRPGNVARHGAVGMG